MTEKQIIDLIDKKIKEYQSKSQLAVKMPIDCEYKQSCLHNQEINVCNASKLAILKELRKEIYQE